MNWLTFFLILSTAVNSKFFHEGNTDTTILSTEDRKRLELTYGPDGNIAAVTVEGTKYFYFASGGPNGKARTVRVKKSNMFTNDITSENVKLDIKDPKFVYAAFGALFYDEKLDGYIAFYHGEEKPFKGKRNFYTSIGIAYSKDGLNFEDRGIILETALKKRELVFAADLGGATFTIVNGNIFLYIKDTMPDAKQIPLSVAKCNLDDLRKSIKNKITPKFSKYYQGKFDQPGLGGLSSAILKVPSYLRWPAVSYNPDLGIFQMVFSQSSVNWKNSKHSYLHYTYSFDGITWNEPKIIRSETELNEDGGHNGAEFQYPTLYDPSLHSSYLNDGDLEVFYIYSKFEGAKRWKDGVLKKFNLTN